MRLVRGSILSSETCSTSKAARILRRFMCSDGATDDSVRSFLTNAARSLESMGEGAHSSLKKSKKKNKMFDSYIATDSENPNEGLSGSGQGQEPQTQPSAFKTPVTEDGKHMKKREKSSKHYVDSNLNDTEEVNATEQETEDDKHTRKSKKKRKYEEDDAGRLEKIDFDPYATPTVQKKLENAPMANGFRVGDGISTSAALNQCGSETSGQLEKKKRKKEKEHHHSENHDGILRNMREKTDLEFKETHSTHKKSRKPRSSDRLDDDNGNILLLSSSRKSKQRGGR